MCPPQTPCGGGGNPNHCGCTPTTRDAEGATCGTIADGCAATLDCGACAVDQACDASSHHGIKAP